MVLWRTTDVVWGSAKLDSFPARPWCFALAFSRHTVRHIYCACVLMLVPKKLARRSELHQVFGIIMMPSSSRRHRHLLLPSLRLLHLSAHVAGLLVVFRANRRLENKRKHARESKQGHTPTYQKQSSSSPCILPTSSISCQCTPTENARDPVQ